jgi:CheY-like chemotaxis protein
MKRILVVDDSPDTADTMAMLLETSGHEVRTATSGADALSIVDSFRPDLVLLDIGMPDMDGYAIARQLRARNALRGALLAAVTGYDGADDRRKSREAGFHHHLVKPVGLQEVNALFDAPPSD